MAEGSQRYLAYAVEDEIGTAETALQKIRNTGGSGIANERTNITSNEIRDDRAIVTSRLGNNQPNLTIPFEFSYGEYDDFILGALGAASFAAITLTANTSLSVTASASAKTYVLSTGTWYAMGVRVGDVVTLSGFSVATGNNQDVTITYLDGVTMTCANDTVVDTTGAESGVAVNWPASRSVTVAKAGTTATTFTIEEGFTDLTIPQYQYVAGAYVNTWAMSIQPDAVVSGSFDLQGMIYGALSASDLGTASNITNANEVFDSYTGVLYVEGLTETCIVTGLDFSLSNGLNRRYALMDVDACSIGQGRTNVTGTINAYFNSATLSGLFNEEETFHISVRLQDLDGNSYTIGFPTVKLTSDGKDVSENDVTQTLNFQALGTDTTDKTMYVRKQPAA